MESFLCIAIPTMKRWSFLKQNLPLFLSRPEVLEVVICDETGEDVKEIEASPFYNHQNFAVIQIQLVWVFITTNEKH